MQRFSSDDIKIRYCLQREICSAALLFGEASADSLPILKQSFNRKRSIRGLSIRGFIQVSGFSGFAHHSFRSLAGRVRISSQFEKKVLEPLNLSYGHNLGDRVIEPTLYSYS
ncbi:hypothetical protein E3N88_42264 [Mikania micrantha]|uniref:Uncharacterized protein n=1 Tax=Mikania micrantha TaxID=192012 RepID=A0A5N6LKH3_9ASTR|nr:hypothetical protein E3N88_42264 [Mikania micrantha]